MSAFDRMKRAVRDEVFELLEHCPPPVLPASVKLKAAPKIAAPKLNLADYIEHEVEPPPAVHRSHLDFPFGMLLNDRIGDCGEAMAIHGIEAEHLDAGTPVPPFGDPEAQALYEIVGGYNPADPSTDQGTDNQVLVDKWRDVGVTDAAGNKHTIAGSLFVPQEYAKLAIWEFVVLYRAVGLPRTAEGQDRWKLTDASLQGDAAVGSWGYHDIPYLSYDARRVRTITWGTGLLADWEFDKAYAVQGFVTVSQEMLNLQGVSPAGVNWTKLNQDLAKFPPAPSN